MTGIRGTFPSITREYAGKSKDHQISLCAMEEGNEPEVLRRLTTGSHSTVKATFIEQDQ